MLRPTGRLPKRIWIVFLLEGAILFAAGSHPARVSAQERSVANPLAGKPAAIKEGASLFRANCSPCHGLSARGGVRGPDLSSNHWNHGSRDSDIFRNITQGIPGTEMPSLAFADTEIWAIVAYLRSLSPPTKAGSGPGATGERAKGEKIFWTSAGCSACHMVNGRGGRLGPELSRVGASRPASYLVDSIRNPSKDLSGSMVDPNNALGMPMVYDTVTVVTPTGERITGIEKNEDTFSVQLLDTNQRLQFFQKKDLKEVIHEPKSLMPAYSEQMLSPADLQNLVTYLQSLRGN